MTASTPECAATWARTLPAFELQQLARAAKDGAAALAAVRAEAFHSEMLRACDWVADRVAAGEGAYVAGLLDGAFTQHRLASGQSIEVVWTGPPSEVTSSRLTVAVIAALIGEAQREILLVSYASYPPKIVLDALIAASQRGVEIVILAERPADRPGFQGVDVPMPQLRCTRLHWPASARTPRASLHAKLLVIDGATALVGSANFTGNAMEQNLECGLLVRGGPVPGSVRAHLMSLECLHPIAP